MKSPHDVRNSGDFLNACKRGAMECEMKYMRKLLAQQPDKEG